MAGSNSLFADIVCKDWTVLQVCSFLRALGFEEHAATVHLTEVDGPIFGEVVRLGGLEDLGITSKLHRAKVFAQLRRLQANPLAPPEISPVELLQRMCTPDGVVFPDFHTWEGEEAKKPSGADVSSSDGGCSANGSGNEGAELAGGKHASGMPKRPASAFKLWADEHRPAIVERTGAHGAPEVHRAVGEEWAKVSDGDRASYYNQASKLKMEYHIRMHEFAKSCGFGDSYLKKKTKMGVKRMKKDPDNLESGCGGEVHEAGEAAETGLVDDCPRRPPSDYVIFLKENRPKIAERIGSNHIGPICKAAGVEWSQLSREERQIYEEKHEKLKVEYDEALRDYLAKGGVMRKRKYARRESKDSDDEDPKRRKTADVQRSMGSKAAAQKNGYVSWLEDNRSTIMEQIGSSDAETVAKAAAEAWASLPTLDKIAYEERAEYFRKCRSAEHARSKKMMKEARARREAEESRDRQRATEAKAEPPADPLSWLAAAKAQAQVVSQAAKATASKPSRTGVPTLGIVQTQAPTVPVQVPVQAPPQSPTHSPTQAMAPSTIPSSAQSPCAAGDTVHCAPCPVVVVVKTQPKAPLVEVPTASPAEKSPAPARAPAIAPAAPPREANSGEAALGGAAGIDATLCASGLDSATLGAAAARAAALGAVAAAHARQVAQAAQAIQASQATQGAQAAQKTQVIAVARPSGAMVQTGLRESAGDLKSADVT